MVVEVGIIVLSWPTYQCGGDFFGMNPTRAKLKTYFYPQRTRVNPVHPNTPLALSETLECIAHLTLRLLFVRSV